MVSHDAITLLLVEDNEGKEYGFIVLTVDERIETAVNAMKAGALDFLPKFRGFDELPDMICKVHDIHKERLEKKKIEVELLESEERLKASLAGLIVNELVTNSYKYAYPDNQAGDIRISFHAVDDDITELMVSDNGVGLPDAIVEDESLVAEDNPPFPTIIKNKTYAS